MSVRMTAVLVIAMVLSLAFAAHGSEARYFDFSIPQPPGYPIDSTVATTLDRTVVPIAVPAESPVLMPSELSKYSEYGYGLWDFGEGMDFDIRKDLMPSDYTGATAIKSADLLHFFTITDIHITDKESPAQVLSYGARGGPGSMSSAYSGIMLYTTQVLDAAIQTANAINKKNPFDFGISLGDTCNTRDYIELRWYIDVIDGQMINPDSGDKDDPIPGPLNDYQDRYKAAGLDRSIPWYQTIGNHDQYWMGIAPPTEDITAAYTGTDILNLGPDVLTDFATAFTSRGFYMGSMDGRTLYGDIIGMGPLADFPEGPPQVLAADPNRRPVSRTEWMNEFFNTTSLPVGHGFSQTNIDNNFACYSFEPKWNVPIKIIVLDDILQGAMASSALDQARYDWLVSELDSGQSEGKLMILAMHSPIGVEPIDSPVGWSSSSTISEATLEAKLHTYPNFLAVIAGHRHLNTITAFKSPDDAHPELGFWQIETSSLRDYPQQLRDFNIVRNRDNTVSIFTTDVDPAVRPGSPADISRTYAVGAQELFNNALASTPTGSYNAELIKQLSPELADVIDPVVAITGPTSAATIARNCPTLTISGTASDNKAVASVIWTNSANGQTGAGIFDGTSWSADSVSLDAGENPISVTASDAAGNTATATIIVTYIKTLPGSSWRGLTMVSLPIVPDQTDPKIEVGFVDNGWCSFNASLNEYSSYPAIPSHLQPAEETPSRGFWARFGSAAIPYGTIPDQTHPATIHLLPGWNLIGNPFISDVKWDVNAIRVVQPGTAAFPLKDSKIVVSSYAWGWNQNAADPTTGSYYLIYDSALKPGVSDTLKPWHGYWIMAVRECYLIIPAPHSVSTLAVAGRTAGGR